MRKIVIAFDGTHFSQSALEYANLFNSDKQSLVVGVFVSGLYNYPVPVFYEGMVSMNLLKPDTEDEDVILSHIKTFEDYCVKENITYRVHRITEGNILDELVYETRYADLAIVAGSNFLKLSFEKYVNENVQMFLEDAECPVVIVPDNCAPVENIILSYDSSPSSIKAIKAFAYTLSSLTSTSAHLVKIVPEKADHNFNLGNRMEEYLAHHFQNLSLTMLEGKPGEELNNFIRTAKNPMLVIGAYGRGYFSQLLRKSLAHDIISEHKIPIFIFH